LAHRLNGDRGGTRRRITIHAAADGGKGNTMRTDPAGGGQRVAVAGGQQIIFTPAATVPHRSDGMDDMACREAIPRRHFGVPGLAPAERTAFDKQLRACGTMDRTVHAATAK